MPVPMLLAFAILDFAALLGVALAADRCGYRRGALVLAIFACVVLAWGVIAWVVGMAALPR